ncbi:MAG TPA: SMP-30/gluconolactonase/LRE family protein [Gemmatales bacterium]|nr:SMP-30/gluconolactonase/LRE family protein [Gemmatales bacterium]HMP17077.1 SMP-30/gluconolactonase/LRE family protein [Gemmatales bacterium]
MHRRTFLVASLAGVSATLLSYTREPSSACEPMGEIVRLDPRMDTLLGQDARLDKIAGGFDWAEGPVWQASENRLLFSDIPKNMVWQWSPDKGLSAFLKPSGYTGDKKRGGEAGCNGLAFNPEGKLVLCQHGDRRIAMLEDDGRSFMTLADKYEGKRFNSPNDLAYHSGGDLYFTDPPYGLEKGPDDPARELDFCGVFRLGRDGKVTLLTKDLTRPNGIAFSPDEKTLYVANSDPKRAYWMAYPVKQDGTLGEGRIFLDVTKELPRMKGLPDGLKVDVSGNLFATGPGGVWVVTAGAEVLGRIDPGCATANCGFGEDGSTLFLTADKSLCRVRTKTRGWK